MGYATSPRPVSMMQHHADRTLGRIDVHGGESKRTLPRPNRQPYALDSNSFFFFLLFLAHFVCCANVAWSAGRTRPRPPRHRLAPRQASAAAGWAAPHAGARKRRRAGRCPRALSRPPTARSSHSSSWLAMCARSRPGRWCLVQSYCFCWPPLKMPNSPPGLIAVVLSGGPAAIR